MTDLDPRFHTWLTEQAPRRAPADLLERVMEAIEPISQQRRIDWPMSRYALVGLSAALLMLAVALGLTFLNRPRVVALPPTLPLAPATGSPTATPTPTTAATASQLPVVGVTARIPLPSPDAQAVFPEQVAVNDDAIWTASFSSTDLLQIDTATNRLRTQVDVMPSLLAAGDGQVWSLSPWGGAPALKTVQLSRLDPASGTPVLVAELPYADTLAVGLGGVWIAGGSQGLTLLDATSGKVLRQLPVDPVDISVACGSLWAWNLDDVGWSLDRLDPMSGRVLDHYTLSDEMRTELSKIDGECWAHDRNSLSHLLPGSIVQTTMFTGFGSLYVTADSAWSLWGDTLRRIDPTTGTAVGPSWRLPASDLEVVNAKIGDDYWFLSADASLWLVRHDALVRFGIPTR